MKAPFIFLKDLDLYLILGIQSTAGFLSYQLVRTAVNYMYLQCQVQISSWVDLYGLKEELAGSEFPKTMCQHDPRACTFPLQSITTLADSPDYSVISCWRHLSDKSAGVVSGRNENTQPCGFSVKVIYNPILPGCFLNSVANREFQLMLAGVNSMNHIWLPELLQEVIPFWQMG